MHVLQRRIISLLVLFILSSMILSCLGTAAHAGISKNNDAEIIINSNFPLSNFGLEIVEKLKADIGEKSIRFRYKNFVPDFNIKIYFYIV